jgi:CubicO group peptidase (beta-lactamase class C family)
MKPKLLQVLVVVLLAFDALASSLGESRYPGTSWERWRAPEPLGWSLEKLAVAHDYATTIHTAAMMVIVGGQVLDEWGETATRFNIHSIRKSFLNALYGIHVSTGHINLSATLGELGIDDNEPSLTSEEKQATVGDLLKARSGVYHAAVYETAAMQARRPPRGNHAPGTFWYYNNWDFNVLGTIFERQTKTNLFAEFKARIADPIGMGDFRLEDCTYVTGADSVYPAYPFRMTARDMARFGLLFLRAGAARRGAGGEASGGASGQRTPGREARLRERVVARGQLLAARRRVQRKGGRPGLDGRTVEAWPGSLRAHWPQRRAALRAGTDRPSPVTRVELPTPGGGVRQLGRPTGRDRVIPPARLQGLPPEGDKSCSAGRDGFRPGGSPPQAVAHAQRYLGERDGGVVALDLEPCVDRVHHDKRMRLVQKRVEARRVLKRLAQSRKAGAVTEVGVEGTVEGTPPGGPVSPRWAKLRLDERATRRGRVGDIGAGGPRMLAPSP